MKYGFTLRNQDYWSGLIDALLICFFWRWNHSEDQFISFCKSLDWYDIKVLKRNSFHLMWFLNSFTPSSWIFFLYEKSIIKNFRIIHIRCLDVKKQKKIRCKRPKYVFILFFYWFSTIVLFLFYKPSFRYIVKGVKMQTG